MSRKLLLGVAATVSALAMTSSFASANGVYLGMQAGWGNTQTHGITQTRLNNYITEAFPAIAPAAIAGIDDYTVISFNRSSDRNGWAGRLYAGYQLDCHWAAELGWTNFTNVRTNATETAAAPVLDVVPNIFTTAYGKVKTDSVDLVAKYTYPLPNSWSVFAKLGVSYVWQREKTNAQVSFNTTAFESSSRDKHSWMPAFGLGVGYDITQNFVADVSWMRNQNTSDGNNKVKSTDLVTAGLRYNLGC